MLERKILSEEGGVQNKSRGLTAKIRECLWELVILPLNKGLLVIQWLNIYCSLFIINYQHFLNDRKYTIINQYNYVNICQSQCFSYNFHFSRFFFSLCVLVAKIYYPHELGVYISCTLLTYLQNQTQNRCIVYDLKSSNISGLLVINLKHTPTE